MGSCTGHGAINRQNRILSSLTSKGHTVISIGPNCNDVKLFHSQIKSPPTYLGDPNKQVMLFRLILKLPLKTTQIANTLYVNAL